MDSSSSLSFQSLGSSIEIPIGPTSPDAVNPDGFVPSPNPPPPSILAEISAECQTRPSQELIESLDKVRRLGGRVPTLG